MRAALAELAVDLDVIAEVEPDAALGNGGLGASPPASWKAWRRSASPPRLRHPLDLGLFRQELVDGWQRELPETGWPRQPLGVRAAARPPIRSASGAPCGERGLGRQDAAIWGPGETVTAVAYDTPILGWRGEKVNTLRLWRARAIDPIRLDAFNMGDHIGALADRNRAESISRVLYPSDATPAGQELRLRQEYFFTSASLQDLVRRHAQQFGDVRTLPEKAAIQLNDTHPAIAVAELMRLLVDVHNLGWEEAWSITNRTIAYTNHTLLPEALESWPVTLMERLLPRHMQIIFALNAKLHGRRA